MDSNLPPGCKESDLPGNEPTSQAYDTYAERMDAKQQLEVCLAYIDKVDGYDRFDEWAFERIKKEHPEWIVQYVESLDSFWDYLHQDSEGDYDPRER